MGGGQGSGPGCCSGLVNRENAIAHGCHSVESSRRTGVSLLMTPLAVSSFRAVSVKGPTSRLSVW